MNHKYVRKCKCCNEEVSLLRVPSIPVRHKCELVCLMHDALAVLKMKGELSLVCTEDLIVGFNYKYANKAELKLSEAMCDSLHDIASKFEWRYVGEAAIHYYSAEGSVSTAGHSLH